MQAMIERFGRKIQMERTLPGAYDEKGRWSPGVKTRSTIMASVQPLPTDEMLKLPENQRSKEAVKIYTTAAVQIVNEKTKTNSDVFIIDEKRFEAFAIVDFFLPGSMNIRYFRIDAISENEENK